MLTKVSSENAAAETDENADDPILEERNGVDGEDLTKERGESLKDAEQLFEADFPGFTIDDDFPGWSSTSNTDQVGTTDVVSSTNSWDYNLPGVSLYQSGLIGGSMSDNLYAQGMMSQQYEMEDSGSGYQQQALNISLCEPRHFDSDLPRSGNLSRNLHFLLPSTSHYGVQLPNTNFLNNINSAALETINPNRDPPGRLSVQLPNIYVDVVVGQTSALGTNITAAELLLSPSSAYNNHGRSFSSSNINVEETRCKCKKSECLKLYCDCFALGMFCGTSCACINCWNKSDYEDSIQTARDQIQVRNPHAFDSRVNKTRGCNCRRSKCVKNYCECYQANAGCCQGCHCHGCANPYGSRPASIYRIPEGLNAANLNSALTGLPGDIDHIFNNSSEVGTFNSSSGMVANGQVHVSRFLASSPHGSDFSKTC